MEIAGCGGMRVVELFHFKRCVFRPPAGTRMLTGRKSEKMGKQPKSAISPTRREDYPEWYQQVIKAPIWPSARRCGVAW